MYIFVCWKVMLCILFIFIKFLLNIILTCLVEPYFTFHVLFVYIWIIFIIFFLSIVFFCCVEIQGIMAPQVTINFDELPSTFVIKRRIFQARKNMQVVFTIGPRSILAEFTLSNSMESLWSLERASKLAPKIDKSLTKKAIKNLKRNKCRSDKHCI